MYTFSFDYGDLSAIGPGSLDVLDIAITLRDEGVLEWILQKGEPMETEAPSTFSEEPTEADRLLILPLIVGEEPFGVFIGVMDEETGEISDKLKTISFLFASQAAVAIKHSNDYVQTLRMKEHMRRLLETVNDTIFTTDEAGLIVYTNGGVEQFGLRPSYMVGKPVYSLLPVEFEKGRTLRVLQQGETFAYEAELPLTNGEKKWYLVQQVPLKESPRKIIGSLGIIRDIGDRKQIEKQLRQKERLRTLSETSVSINHEINNPLTIVQGNLYLMEQFHPKKDDPQVSKMLEAMKDGLKRIRDVVKKFENMTDPRSVKYQDGIRMIDLSSVSVEQTEEDDPGEDSAESNFILDE